MVFLITTITLSILIVVLYIYYKRKLKANEARTLNELVNAQEDERLRVSEYIHENLSQDIVYSRHQLASLIPISSPENKDSVNQLLNNIDHTINKLRIMSYNLSPPPFHLFSLNEALEEYCRNTSVQDFIVRLNKEGDSKRIDKKKKALIYRILQELVENMKQNNSSQTVLISTQIQQNKIQFSVEGSNISFNSHTIVHKKKWRQMQNRIRILNAKYTVKSNANKMKIVFTVE